MRARMPGQVVSHLGAVVLVAASIAGCASTGAVSKPKEPVHTDCVFRQTVNDWSPLDDKHLIIYGLTDQDAYLARLFFPNPDLTFNLGVAIVDDDRSGSICGGSTDGLFFGPRSAVPGKNTIVSMQKISKAQAEKLLSLRKDKDALQAELAATGMRTLPAAAPAPATPN
jgi:Family of unknown function (DUF6491)